MPSLFHRPHRRDGHGHWLPKIIPSGTFIPWGKGVKDTACGQDLACRATSSSRWYWTSPTHRAWDLCCLWPTLWDSCCMWSLRAPHMLDLPLDLPLVTCSSWSLIWSKGFSVITYKCNQIISNSIEGYLVISATHFENPLGPSECWVFWKPAP